MRLMQLTFTGLRSYRGQAHSIDFTGKSLVGVLGDTGAGKTTLLEAVIFALYGTPSWAKDGVKDLIAQGEPYVSVDLTFSHDGHTWQIRRVYYARNRQPQHVLRNLDTDERFDNRGAVNRRIERLLKLRREDFQSAVLPPQGKFDMLLNATDTVRSQILEGIFGTSSLKATRALADQQRTTIQTLLDQAHAARNGFLRDPAQEAKTAALAAEAAQQRAAHLEGVHAQMSSLQSTAAAHRSRSTDLHNAHRSLAASLGQLDTTGLDALEAVEQDLSGRERQLTSEETAAQAARDKAQEKLQALAEQGATAATVSAAQTVLAGLPKRLANLNTTQARLADEQQRLDHDAERLQADQGRIETLRRNAEELQGQADSAGLRAETTGKAFTELIQTSQAALEAAAALAHAREAEGQAAATQLEMQQRLPALRDEAARADQAAAAAVERVEAAVRSDAAHAAGRGLHPGDDCSVCAQTLPADYQPPQPADPAQLTAATKARTDADHAAKTASKKLTRGEAALEGADRELGTARDALEQAARHLDEQAARAEHTAASPQLSPQEDPGAGQRAFAQELGRTLHAVQQPGGSGEPKDLIPQRDALCTWAKTVAEAAVAQAETARDNARSADHQAQSAADVLAAEQANLTARQQTQAASCRELDEEVDALQDTLFHMPPPVAAPLPDAATSIGAPHLQAAQRALDEVSGRLQDATGDLETANKQLARVAKARLDLDKQHRSALQQPLTTLLTRASGLIAVAQTAQSVLDPALPPLATPAAGPLSVAVVRESCQAAIDITNDLLTRLTSAREAEHAELVVIRTDLEREARQIGTDDQGTPLVSFPDGIALEEPAALDPLSRAIGAANHAHTEQSAHAARATRQIEPAGKLDHAIEQGRSRLADLNELYMLLADSKFPKHLTERRTSALLHVASDKLTRLSRGQFGFGANFAIMTLATRSERSAKTLSGGETFLASLALALALVELHSRNGARLGSLFLDEGFAALDSTMLASALSVLQDESGSDKLVVVISHLHAVAETVDDVLWVQRSATGSQTRWLTGPERDALVYETGQSGLLGLTDTPPA